MDFYVFLRVLFWQIFQQTPVATTTDQSLYCPNPKDKENPYCFAIECLHSSATICFPNFRCQNRIHAHSLIDIRQFFRLFPSHLFSEVLLLCPMLAVLVTIKSCAAQDTHSYFLLVSSMGSIQQICHSFDLNLGEEYCYRFLQMLHPAMH